MKKFLTITFALGLTCFAGCSTGSQKIESQKYATLPDHRTFEYDFPTVWKGIEAASKEYVVTNRDPKEVDPLEMKKLTERTLETDWVYTQSRDKYFEYKINDSPRKKYLQARIKYNIVAKSVVGGVDVRVKTTEEIERLKSDGTPDGYVGADEVDTSRPQEVLDRIDLAILSAAPI